MALRLLAVMAAVAALATFASTASAATVVRVDETSMVTNPADAVGGHWAIVDQSGNGSLAFVDGPATPPLGIGSLNLMTTGNTDKIDVFNYDIAGTPASALSALSFWTYTTDTNATLAPVFQMEIYRDGSTGYSTVNFEPYVMGTVVPNTWQEWTLSSDPLVWITRSPVTAGDQSHPIPWSELMAMYPSATLLSTGFNAGSNWTGSFSGNADDLSLTVNGATTVYDFEHAVTLAGKDFCKDGGWQTSTNPTFRNQGDCVSYFASNGRTKS